MADAQINRFHRTASLAIAAAATSAGPLDIRGFAGGQLHFPATWVGGTATFRGRPSLTGTPYPIYDYAKVAQVLTGTLGGKVFEIPPAVLAGHFLDIHRAVASAAAGAKTIRVVLKG